MFNLYEMTDEELAEGIEGAEQLTELIQDVQKVIDDPETYTKDEVVNRLKDYHDFLSVLVPGMALAVTTVQGIRQMENDIPQ